MDKKIPKVFANKIENKAGNNEEIYYSNDKLNTKNKQSSVEPKNISKPNMNVNQKINLIFNSSNYIYKADCEIKLRNETIEKRIVGKNMTHLITMDNELIPITDIIDIKRK